jgi:hypothetical protein
MRMSGSGNKNIADTTNIFLSKSNLLFSQGLNFTNDFDKYKEHDNDVILNVSIKEDIGDDLLQPLESEKLGRVSSL